MVDACFSQNSYYAISDEMTQVGYMYFEISTNSLDSVIEWHVLLVQVPVVVYQQYRVVASPVLCKYHICRCKQVHNENNLAQPHMYIS